jgi:PAS domain S-box-containing protein
MKKSVSLSEEQLQESMWIEIIKRMETIYAELANNQAEIERKNRELLQAQEFTENILKSMVDALIVVDSEEKIEMVNQATLDLLGYQKEEIIKKPVKMILANAKEKRRPFNGSYLSKFKDSSVQDLEIDFKSKSGEKIPMTLSSSIMRNSEEEIIGVIGVAKDLRETKWLLAEAAAAEAERTKAQELERAYKDLKDLQSQLVHSERLACIGQLAAGVAHEINNPLGGILVYSHLLLEDLTMDDSKRADVGRIIKEATRCKDIVKRLLDFARQPEPKVEPLSINAALEENLSLVKDQALFHNIKITKKFHPSPPHIMGDKSQLQQAFMNIILNAAEAMDGKGNLIIATRALPDTRFLEIAITDNGCGIPPAHIKRLFEPFFTTKKAGHGTGLGLAITAGIIERHNGSIEVQSKVKEGATFTIKLPV